MALTGISFREPRMESRDTESKTSQSVSISHAGRQTDSVTEDRLSEYRLAQQVVRSILEYGEGDPDAQEAYKADPSMTTGLWYERRCLPLSQISQSTLLEVLGMETTLMFGRFGDLQHAWLEFEDGTILDPTARQMGIEEEAAIITPTDPRSRNYRMRGCWKEGDGEIPPD